MPTIDKDKILREKEAFLREVSARNERQAKQEAEIRSRGGAWVKVADAMQRARILANRLHPNEDTCNEIMQDAELDKLKDGTQSLHGAVASLTRILGKAVVPIVMSQITKALKGLGKAPVEEVRKVREDLPAFIGAMLDVCIYEGEAQEAQAAKTQAAQANRYAN